MSLHFLPSILLGVPEHLGDPVGAVQGLLLLVGHGGAGDVQVGVGSDHGHRLTFMEAKVAVHLILGRNIRFKFVLCVTDSFAWSSPGS